MPAVMSRKQFDARIFPLRNNLALLAEKAVGFNDAHDVLQEALVTAWIDIPKFNAACDQPAFLAWLHSILQFKISEYICARAFERETTLPSSTIFEMCDGPGALHWESDGWQEQREELYRRLNNATLTPQQRECALRWVGGETLREIGATQPNPITAVAVHYIIKSVGRLLRDLEDEDAYDPRLGQCIHNFPSALTLAGQEMTWNRYRREANIYAQRHSIRHAVTRKGRR